MSNFPVFPPDKVLSRSVEKIDALSECLRNGIARLRLRPVRSKRMNAILGLEGHLQKMSLADTEARKVSVQVLFDIVREEGPRLMSDGDSIFHITLVDDIGLTSDRKPTIQWTAFRCKVDKAIRAVASVKVV